MKNSPETRYQYLVEHLNDAVYTVGIQSSLFTSVNTAGQKLTGYTREELFKTPITTVIAPEFIPLVKKMIQLKKRKDQATIYEIEIVRKDGSRVPVEISSLAIYENGVPTEILGVARDITERKTLEQQRNIFISLITHEIRNPLTSAKLYLELLHKRLKQDTTARSYIQTATKQMTTINQLMSDFLDIMQMRVGKFQIMKESFDLNEAINEVTKPFQKRLTITRIGKATKKIMADRNRICQVLVNLLSNAEKYSEGKKDVKITVKQTTQEVIVAVADHGIGISKADQQQIFDIYFRNDTAMKSKIKGHGLGLYICREIIAEHKGKLWVESELHKGSTFFFSLPV